MSQQINLETLLRVPYIEPDLGFDISPDGHQVAFSWNATGRWEIYTLNLDVTSTLKQISVGEGAKFAPRWSPDGRKLAYVLDLDGGENYDIISYGTESGVHTNLTPNTSEALTSSFAWSPDGQWIAICSDRDGRFDTYIMPSDGGEIRKLLDQAYPDWVVHWSPDGRHLAVVSEGEGQNYLTTIVPVSGGEGQTISLNGKPFCAKGAVWSPDGGALAFTSNHSGQYEIGIFKLDSSSISWVTSGEGEKEFPDWSPDGEKLAYVISHGPCTQLGVYSLRNGFEQTFQIEPGVIFSPHFTPDSSQVLFIFDNPRHPDDLWALSLATGKLHQLTTSLPEGIDKHRLVMPKEVTYPGLDGVQVPALLYRSSKRAKAPPAVLYVHGGPNWLTQVTWDPLVQHMVNRGWVVLAPNYRGSTGYGRDWQLASRFDLGGVDTQDVVAGADFLVDQGIADPSKIAVTGRSWGGYLTMTCLTQYPERWAVGSASVPFLNWFTSHKNSREDLQHWDRENFGDPEMNYDLWYQHSPFFFLDRIQAPVQLLCGANDVRCPASESKQAYEKLIEEGKECDYVLYPDEGHALLKIENQVDAKKRRVEFLAKYLER
jgi:dipeptidyl aminopeptidase/acylaminoacyl peptidase